MEKEELKTVADAVRSWLSITYSIEITSNHYRKKHQAYPGGKV